MEETLSLTRINPDQAAAAFEACPDPLGDGATDLQALAERSECVQLQGHAGALVMALQLRHGPRRDVLWIAGAAGQGGHDWTHNGLAVAEHQAKVCGAHSVGFQTARRGLVKLAKENGYRLAGYILVKDIKK